MTETEHQNYKAQIQKAKEALIAATSYFDQLDSPVLPESYGVRLKIKNALNMLEA